MNFLAAIVAINIFILEIIYKWPSVKDTILSVSFAFVLPYVYPADYNTTKVY